ncbi:MAG: phospho-sugar mutase [Clostridia bacterium]|nr:phospho-sugar mutase [Clostridia bacterium]
MSFVEKYKIWKMRVKDRKLLRELSSMSDEQISSAFYKDLEFGTAGIRALMGAGTNRINIYTVRKITQGVALYMTNNGLKKVVISYDSRIDSSLFAKTAASVFAAAGISVFITPTLMPTPFLSYAVREMGCDIGVMVTASHNPAKYNGYKVYDSSGCQICEDKAQVIAQFISKVDAFRVNVHSFEYYLKHNDIVYLQDSVLNSYIEQVKSVLGETKADVSVVYTPLNGTGYKIVPSVLVDLGCAVKFVEPQMEPNGRFPTCHIPNPEKKEALKRAISLLTESNSDIAIATDPDADRIGVAYREGERAVILSGNEIGIILSEHLLRKHKGKKTPLIVRTIVSTSLVDKIADKYGAQVVTVPTGFKYIGNVINSLEQSGDADRFLIGFEESQGYLVGSYARDKDAVVASALVALIASELKSQGKTLGDRLGEIYDEYGESMHMQLSYKFEGAEGEQKMKSLFDRLKAEPLESVACSAVLRLVDYALELDMPTLNVIGYEFDGGSVIIRPSGTEPLIKLYVSLNMSARQNARMARLIKKQFSEIFS